MIHPHEGEACVFTRVVHASRDVVAVEINCTRVAIQTHNCIKKQLVLSEPENMVRIRGGGCGIGYGY